MENNKKVSYHTLGCKLNYSETDAIARSLEEHGYTKAAEGEKADYFVINTCSVTESANKKSRYLIRKAYTHNPKATVIIVGCYAQLKPHEISVIPGVSMVLGAQDKFNVHNKIQEYESNNYKQIISSCDISDVSNFQSSYSLTERTRSFLKVQDGCDYVCSYCTIPQARGKSRNATIATIMEQARQIAQSGIKEIVLTGINIGDFGRSTDENFLQLLTALDTVEGIERIRISSIEPNLLTTDIIQFVAQSRACMPHFHIPLQAGTNEVLALMRRRYTVEFFEKKLHEIKSIIPHAGIGIDVIVGTPGETSKLFKQSVQFVQSLPASYLHVFTYSERENTDALKIAHKVPVVERHDRSVEMHEVSATLKKSFEHSYLNTARKVLFESKQKNGYFAGYTDNYIHVQSNDDRITPNSLHNVELNAEGLQIQGKLVL